MHFPVKKIGSNRSSAQTFDFLQMTTDKTALFICNAVLERPQTTESVAVSG